MSDNEQTLEREHDSMNIIPLGPLEYGNPEAKITGRVDPFIFEKSTEVIESKKCMVEVHHHDDGCIDGRGTEKVIFYKDGEEYINDADNSNHERFKVAGGGYMTGSAMLLGAEGPQVSIDAQIAYTTELLGQKGIYCGAHTGAHENGESTDCGANDKYDVILGKGLDFKDNIGANVEAIVTAQNLSFDAQKLETVFARWQAVLGAQGFFEGSTGQSRLNEVKKTLNRAEQETTNEEQPAVIKRLAGDHKEAFIVANLVESKTFSQGTFASELKAKVEEAGGSVENEALPQAFVVDIPRIKEIAKALAEQTGDDFDELYYSGLAYQFATAATLTDGTLHTFIVE